ncbi:hypothetical protein PMAYCL1PPCAC_13298, partial [Pristionchus mayeri]
STHPHSLIAPRMGVVSWLALVALVAYRIPTVSADDVILHIVSRIDDKNLLHNVTNRAMTKAAVKLSSPSPQDGKCLESRPAEQKKHGLIFITDSAKCKDVKVSAHRLLLVYNATTKKFTTDKDKSLNVTELDGPLEEFVRFIDVNSKPVQQQTEYGIRVPVYAIVGVGVLTGLFLALSCIFFSMFRAATRKAHPIDKPKPSSNWAKSGSSSQRSNASVKKQKKVEKKEKKGSSLPSKSTTSTSETDSSKGKVKETCRSSKSLATKTCDISGPSSVQVISIPPPKPKQSNASQLTFVLPKDEATTAKATSGAVQPVRDLDRRVPATAPKSCCGSTVPRPTVISSQPRPSSKGPPIVPTVSVIGHAPSPFAVLAHATSPLPPASTPAIFQSAPTAYNSPSQTSITKAPTSDPSTESQQPPVPIVPTSSAPQTTVAPAATTISQSSTPAPTTTSGPQTTVAPS